MAAFQPPSEGITDPRPCQHHKTFWGCGTVPRGPVPEPAKEPEPLPHYPSFRPQYGVGRSARSPTQLLIWLSVPCVLGYEGFKNRGSWDPKTGASFPLLMLSVFKKTVKSAAPQDRSGKCGTAANRALPSGTAPPQAAGEMTGEESPARFGPRVVAWECGCRSSSTRRRRTRSHRPRTPPPSRTSRRRSAAGMVGGGIGVQDGD